MSEDQVYVAMDTKLEPTGRSTTGSFREVGNQLLNGKSYILLLDREGIAMKVIISVVRLDLPVLRMK